MKNDPADLRKTAIVSLIAAAALSLAVSAVHAQSAGPTVAAGMPPVSLPGDQGATQMKPGEVFVPFAGGGPPPWDSGPLAAGPTAAEAFGGARAAIAACAAQHFPIGVSVIDSIGQPRATMVADGARGWHTYSSLRKALTALALEEPSSLAMKEVAGATPLAVRIKPYMTTMPGAVPLVVRGKLIGAIGVSGGRSGEIDESCAKAGAAYILGSAQ